MHGFTVPDGHEPLIVVSVEDGMVTAVHSNVPVPAKVVVLDEFHWKEGEPEEKIAYLRRTLLAESQDLDYISMRSVFADGKDVR